MRQSLDVERNVCARACARLFMSEDKSSCACVYLLLFLSRANDWVGLYKVLSSTAEFKFVINFVVVAAFAINMSFKVYK